MGQDGQMSSPYPPQRPPLARPVHGRVVAGVAAGLADHLGLGVGLVRVALIVMIGAGGAGIAVYAFLWGLVPQSDVPSSARVAPAVVRGRAEPAASPGGPGPQRALGRSDWLIVGGVLVVLLGVVIALGVRVDGGFWVPLLLLGVGAVFAWSQLDASTRRAWAPEDPKRRGWTLVRVVAGVVMAVVGLVLLTTRGQGLTDLWDVIVAVLVVLLGVGFIMTPYAARLWRDLRAEQAARVRATERADIAAHLHDSVLQTLTLIQRRSSDPAVTRLARAQERELRQWLFAGDGAATAGVASAVTEVAHEVEDRYGIPVEVVLIGDAPLDAGATAVVAALREALVNAAVHGAPPISAYLEVGPERVEAFVRDRGEGFDINVMPTDRRGVRESIIGRMERHGGSARVRSMDNGTEVGLSLPRNVLADNGAEEPATSVSDPNQPSTNEVIHET